MSLGRCIAIAAGIFGVVDLTFMFAALRAGKRADERAERMYKEEHPDD